MRILCATIIVAATCAVGAAVGAADVRDQIPAAKVLEAKHVFSMSCKVTAVNGDLATAEGREMNGDRPRETRVLQGFPRFQPSE